MTSRQALKKLESGITFHRKRYIKIIEKDLEVLDILAKFTKTYYNTLQDEHDRDIDFTQINGECCNWDEYNLVSGWLDLWKKEHCK